MIDWEEIRNEHTKTIDGIYLNSPANGLTSSKTIAHEQLETEKFLSNPGKYRMDFITKTVPEIKALLARLLHADKNTVALIQNFSIGLNFFVNALPRSTKIGLIKEDYPSLTMPFEVNNFPIFWMTFEEDSTLDLSKVEQFIKNNQIEVFAISHCQWLTGYLADIESIGAICKQYNCLFLVDSTQSFGAIDIDVQKCNIDVLGASCYKWPLAGFGNGFMYVNQSTLQLFPPKTAGFNSYVWDQNQAVYYPSIRSYEPGHHDHSAFHKLHFALHKITDLGIDTIETKIHELMDYLMEQLDSSHFQIIGDFANENRLGILSIANKPNLFKHLLKHKIEVSERGGNIRLGVHYYNNEEDIVALLQAMHAL